MRAATIALLGMLAAAPVRAQGPTGDDGASARAAMRRLAFLVGEWEGEAAWSRGPGETEKVHLVEMVTVEAGGTVLAVRGTGTRPGAAGAAPEVVHDAFGMITWDGQAYHLRAHTADGRGGEFALAPADSGMTWETPGPGGSRIRYAMLLQAGEWVETGEWLAPGATEGRRFMESRLRRR